MSKTMNTLLWSIFIYAIFEVNCVEFESRPLRINVNVVPRPALIKGGAKRTLLIEAFEGSGLCRIESSDISEIKFHGITENFHISEKSTKAHMVFIEAFDNGIANEKETFEILVICKEMGTDIIRTAQKEVLIYESFDTVIAADPHFVQTIFDEAHQTTKNICYDVSGEAGDIVEIITQNSTGTVIKGELFDDYYMHFIKISYMDGSIISTTDGTKFSDGLSFEWSNSIEHKKIETDSYLIIYNGLTLTIELKNIDKTVKNLNFTLKRSYHTLTGYFMDISFNNLDNYNGLGGLMGKIGNNKFKFFGSVQETEDEVDNSKGAIDINGELMLGTLQSRGDLHCWLVDVEDALYPSNLSEFSSSSLKWEP